MLLLDYVPFKFFQVKGCVVKGAVKFKLYP